jgi:hypothetical protein
MASVVTTFLCTDVAGIVIEYCKEPCILADGYELFGVPHGNWDYYTHVSFVKYRVHHHGTYRIQCHFKNGVLHGSYTRSACGLVYEQAEFDNGMRVGVRRLWHNTNQKAAVLVYEHGALIKQKLWNCYGMRLT